MNEEKNNVIYLDDREFAIVKEIDYKDGHYIYVVSMDDNNDVAILQEYDDNGTMMVESVPDDKVNLLLNIFAKNIFEEIK